MMFDNSKLSGKEATCAMVDLQSCCDRQLASMGRATEESVGRDHAAAKLITKALLNWRHQAQAGFGISKLHCRRGNDQLAGTG